MNSPEGCRGRVKKLKMKTSYLFKYLQFSLLGLLFLSLAGCVTLHPVEMDVLLPAEKTFSPGVKVLGVVIPPYSEATDTTLPTKTADYLADINLNPSDITYAILDGLRDAMDYSPRFRYMNITGEMNIPSDTLDYLGLSEWEQIRQVCHDSVLDALVTVRFMDIVDEVHLALRQELDWEFQGMIDVTDHWKIYEPVEMEVLDNFTKTISVYSIEDSDYLNLLFGVGSSRTRKALEACYWSGHEYALRISPLWETVTRKYYDWPGNLSSQAHEFADQGDWLSAARIWNEETSNSKKSVAAMACLNMAVACEMEDNIEMSVYWAKQSDSLAPYKILTQDYLEVLKQRLEDRAMLSRQMETESDLAPEVPISVMTYNIRFNNPDDGPNAWPNRRQAVISLIRKYDPDLFGLQEALIDQIHEIHEGLGQYSWFGTGRDDGAEKGEFSPVFYRDGRYEFLDGSTFWLSETPAVPGSMGWDAACPRVVTWVKLQDRSSGEILFFFNTHFDHMGDTARMESARFLMDKIRGIAGDYPLVVTGDFNLRESEDPYAILTDKPKEFHLTDTRHQVTQAEGPDYTYMGFDFVGESGEIIDYILVRNFKEILSHLIITDNSNGVYPSDHLPVMAKIIFY